MDKRFGSKFVVMLVLAVVTAGLLLAGCTTPTTSPATNATPTPTTPVGPTNQTIVAMEYGEAASLDPATSDGYDSASYEVDQAVYETLFYFNGSDVSTPVPILATGYSVSPDGLTYTINLRQGVKFHSGDAFNASAVKYSLDRLLLVDNDPASTNFLGTVKGYAAYHASGHTQADVDAYKNASGITILNDSAVQITLESPNSNFIKMLTFGATSIINPAFDQAHGGYNATGQAGNAYLVEHADGTGPFKLDSWDHKQQLVLVRNDNYWGTKALPAKVIIKEVDDYNTRLLALQKGDADIILVDTLHAPDVINDTNLVVETKYGQLQILTINFNLAAWPYSNINVRKAFAESFDADTYVNTTFHGYGMVANGPIPKPLPGYDPNAPSVKFNPDDAKKLLQQAGFSKNNATTLTIYYNKGNQNRQRAATMLKSQIESYDLGITLNIQEMSWGEYIAAMNQKKLPLFIIGWQADYPGSDNYVSAYLSSQGQYGRIDSYKNDTVESLYQQALKEQDPAKQEALYKQIVTAASYDYPVIYVDQPGEFTVYRKGLNGVYFNPINGGLYVKYTTMYK